MHNRTRAANWPAPAPLQQTLNMSKSNQRARSESIARWYRAPACRRDADCLRLLRRGTSLTTLISGAQNAELKALLVKVRPGFVAHLDHTKEVQADLAKTGHWGTVRQPARMAPLAACLVLAGSAGSTAEPVPGVATQTVPIENIQFSPAAHQDRRLSLGCTFHPTMKAKISVR